MTTAVAHSSESESLLRSEPLPGASFGTLVDRARTAYESQQKALQEIDHEHPNLVFVQRVLTQSSAEMTQLDVLGTELTDATDRQAIGRILNTLHTAVDTITSRLSEAPLKALLKEQSKWAEAGFDEGVLVTDPEAVHFAVSSDLLYTILMYKTSADVLEGEITIPIANGKALFLVEGTYLPYEEFRHRIQYSETEKKFIGWNFIHPRGFVPHDTVDFSEMYPIARIKPEAYRRIAQTASQFWSENQEEVDPGREKGYILQVMTTGRACIPRTWWGTNFDDLTPEHTSSRLITPEGEVYSFGTRLRVADAERVTSLSHILETAMTFTSVPDYEEPRPSDEKRVTAIPMTKERFDAIMRYANQANKGFPFNFSTQNCARFVTGQMALAGVSVNIKMSVAQFLYGLLPNLADVPLVGRPLARVIAGISFVVTPIFDILAAVFSCITPYPVRRVWEVVTWGILEIYRRIGAVIINSLFYLGMGAGRSLIPPGVITEKRGDSDNNDVTLPTSARVMNWWDIINPDAIVVYHAFKLRQWQYKQGSSVFYTKPTSGFCCIDPAKGHC